jgi:hypothetical protein
MNNTTQKNLAYALIQIGYLEYREGATDWQKGSANLAKLVATALSSHPNSKVYKQAVRDIQARANNVK